MLRSGHDPTPIRRLVRGRSSNRSRVPAFHKRAWHLGRAPFLARDLAAPPIVDRRAIDDRAGARTVSEDRRACSGTVHTAAESAGGQPRSSRDLPGTSKFWSAYPNITRQSRERRVMNEAAFGEFKARMQGRHRFADAGTLQAARLHAQRY